MGIPPTLGSTLRPALRLALLAGSVLIVLAARGDLWLDEIWSLVFARGAEGVGDLLFRFRHDNNHFLNTLWLYLAGHRETLFIYRLPAVLSGVASLFLVGHLAGRSWGEREALCAVVLTGTSFPLLLYFSEARGYGPAIFFSLASYALLLRIDERPRPHLVALFWATSILGLLSHATFVMASMAFVFASLVGLARAEGDVRPRVLRVAALHLPPLAFIVAWHRLFLRDMVVGGGPVYRVWEVVGEAGVLLLGLPESPVFRVVGLVGVLALVGLGAASLYRDGDRQAPFYVTMLLTAPALLLLLTRPRYLYFRYFVLCFPFFLLLISYLACRAFGSSSKLLRWVGPLAILLLVAGQVPRDARLMLLGRGDFTAALERLAVEAAENGEDLVYVGSDNDFRNRAVFEFYRERSTGGERLRYVESSEWVRQPPDWILAHDQDPSAPTPEEVVIRDVGSFRFVQEFRFAGVSGWNWFLFRRDS